MQDYWHHWEDVAAGLALGLAMAYAFYRLHYPGIASPQAGEAFVPALEAASGERTAYSGDIEAPSFTEAQSGGL